MNVFGEIYILLSFLNLVIVVLGMKWQIELSVKSVHKFTIIYANLIMIRWLKGNSNARDET